MSTEGWHWEPGIDTHPPTGHSLESQGKALIGAPAPHTKGTQSNAKQWSHYWGADEAKDLLKDAQTGFVSVDGPSYSHQYQAVGGGQRPEALRLQIGTEDEVLFPGQG
ncbi:hypothetical protein EYF80_010412 [Liparis tanakae]|uniref:Uncharacterized protein n=1 Tax=Liparis tanakae TaxID=230148 RepID=A0A4Z2IP03_9TELE|nr:hypothetical protein EYF80_010412 [Liparis tanakae]